MEVDRWVQERTTREEVEVEVEHRGGDGKEQTSVDRGGMQGYLDPWWIWMFVDSDRFFFFFLDFFFVIWTVYVSAKLPA